MARSSGEITIPIAADAGAFEKGVTSGIIRPVEDAEKALRDLAETRGPQQLEDAMRDAQKQTEKLKDETRASADAIEKNWKKAYRETKQSSDDATRSMKEGFREAGDEAGQSAREGAASFTGEFDDVGDYIQEVLANALSGFGPAGLVAGVAAAAGIGIAIAKINEMKEAVDDLQERAGEVHLEALEEGVDVEGYVTGLGYVREALQRLNEEGQKKFRWFWEEDSTGLQELVRDLRTAGETQADTTDLFSLGTDQLRDYRDALERNARAYDDQADAIKATERGMGTLTDAELRRISGLHKQSEAAGRVLETIDREIELRSEAVERSDAWAESGAAAASARADTEEQAAERIKGAVQDVEREQLGAYDNMRQAAYEKATADDTAFDINKWLTYVEESRAAADAYRSNLQGMQLTPAEWENLLALPEQARTNIVNSYATSGDEAKARIRSALGDGGGADAGAEAAVAFDKSFMPDAKITPAVDTAKADRTIADLTKPREVVLKVVPDTSAYDAWQPGRKTVSVDGDVSALSRRIDQMNGRTVVVNVEGRRTGVPFQ